MILNKYISMCRVIRLGMLNVLAGITGIPPLLSISTQSHSVTNLISCGSRVTSRTPIKIHFARIRKK